MKFRSLALALAATLTVATANAATQTVDYGQYSVSFDNSTIFGGPAFNFDSDGSVGFGWNVPNTVNLVSVEGERADKTFVFPSFTITANPGWSLSGSVSGFIGNFVYMTMGDATASIEATGMVSVDGSPEFSVSGYLEQTQTSSAPNFSAGILSRKVSFDPGSFTSLSVTNAQLLLSTNATGGLVASIIGQNQNKVEFGFLAQPVPEPESYAMMLAGLALIGAMARRRRLD